MHWRTRSIRRRGTGFATEAGRAAISLLRAPPAPAAASRRPVRVEPVLRPEKRLQVRRPHAVAAKPRPHTAMLSAQLPRDGRTRPVVIPASSTKLAHSRVRPQPNFGNSRGTSRSRSFRPALLGERPTALRDLSGWRLRRYPDRFKGSRPPQSEAPQSHRSDRRLARWDCRAVRLGRKRSRQRRAGAFPRLSGRQGRDAQRICEGKEKAPFPGLSEWAVLGSNQ